MQSTAWIWKRHFFSTHLRETENETKWTLKVDKYKILWTLETDGNMIKFENSSMGL